MKVLALKIKGTKTDIFFKKEAFFETNKGILGDSHAKGGNRQVSILSENSRKLLDSGKLKGLCVTKFHENITVDNLDVDKLIVGDKLKLGDAMIEITSIGKACYRECPLYEKQNTCPLVMDTMFGKIIKSGIVTVEDIVTPLR